MDWKIVLIVAIMAVGALIIMLRGLACKSVGPRPHPKKCDRGTLRHASSGSEPVSAPRNSD